MDQPTRLFDFAYHQQEHNPLDVMMTSKIDGQWATFSTQEFIDQVNLVSRGLLAMGVQPGEKIALISHNNRCEWNIMDMGVLQIGAIDVPIYPTMTEKDYEYIFNHSESRYCFVSNDDLWEKVNNVMDLCPNLEAVFTFEKVQGARHWSEVTEAGKSGDSSKVDEIKSGVKPHDLATIIYTSGTTGLPKGVMLSHNNITSNALDSSGRLPDFSVVKSRSLSFLPVCHIFERMLLYLYMYNGVSIYFAESLETIKEDLNYCKPHMFTAVPRLLEKFYDGIVAKGSANSGIKKKLFLWAVKLALQWEPDRANGGWYEFKLGIARKLVFSKVKAALGLTEILAVASGSAALQARLARFFNGADIPVYEGYGLTETSPVITVNTIREPGMIRVGYVGRPIDNVEVRIEEDGEITCKGPNVMMGYYKNEEMTSEVLKDGWFHTGDIGQIDDGFLKITDRKKEIFKTSGGKYIAPQLLENSLKESTFIEMVMIVGESQKFPAALIVPAYEELEKWCAKNGVTCANRQELCTNEKVLDRVWQDIEKSNRNFGTWEQVKQIRLLAEPFAIETGELTPTLKLKRKAVMTRHAAVVKDIYGID